MWTETEYQTAIRHVKALEAVDWQRMTLAQKARAIIQHDRLCALIREYEATRQAALERLTS